MVVTDEFLKLATSAARGRGYADIPMVVVPHPFETKSEEEVQRIAEEKVEELVAGLVKAAAPMPQPA